MLGARPAWFHRFWHGEMSAVQHAMNLYFEDRRSFLAEHQNEPEDESESTCRLTPELLATKLNGLSGASCRSSVSGWPVTSTSMAVCSTTRRPPGRPEFGGGPIDYGTYPRQPCRRVRSGDRARGDGARPSEHG